MSELPLNAFPIAADSTKSSSFVFAVLVGLALFMSAQNKNQNNRS